jgi:hypothetical protein
LPIFLPVGSIRSVRVNLGAYGNSSASLRAGCVERQKYSSRQGVRNNAHALAGAGQLLVVLAISVRHCAQEHSSSYYTIQMFKKIKSRPAGEVS